MAIISAFNPMLEESEPPNMQALMPIECANKAEEMTWKALATL